MGKFMLPLQWNHFLCTSLFRNSCMILAVLTENLFLWYSSSVELPSVSHSSCVHQALALSRLSDTELHQTVLTVEKLTCQWESHQITEPLLSLPLSRLRATGPNSIAWPCIVLLLAFVLVISSPEKALPFHSFPSKSYLYQAEPNAPSSGKPFLILSPQKSSLIPPILSYSSCQMSVCSRSTWMAGSHSQGFQLSRSGV